MHPSRRQVLGTLAAAGAATLVDPGEVLARLAADVPCAAPAGELVGTLPLFRDRSQVQPFGQKISGEGLDARLITDLSILEPNKLITPNELAYIRTEIPAAAAAHQGPVDDRHVRTARQGRHARPRRPDAQLEEDGPAPVRVLRQRQPVELRPDERGRMGRHSAGRGRRAAEAVEGCDRRAGERLRSHRPELTTIDRRRQLGLPAGVARHARRVPRRQDEWRTGAGRSRQAGAAGGAGLVWLFVDQVGQRNSPGRSRRARDVADGRIRRPHAPEPSRTSWRKTTRRPTSRPRPRPCASRSDARRQASNIASSASCGAAPSRSIGSRFASARQRSGLRDQGSAHRSAPSDFAPFSICPTPKTHAMWSLWEYRWKPSAPGTYDIALKVADPSVPQRRLEAVITCAKSRSTRCNRVRGPLPTSGRPGSASFQFARNRL